MRSSLVRPDKPAIRRLIGHGNLTVAPEFQKSRRVYLSQHRAGILRRMPAEGQRSDESATRASIRLGNTDLIAPILLGQIQPAVSQLDQISRRQVCTRRECGNSNTDADYRVWGGTLMGNGQGLD